MKEGVSCIIPAYNERGRISNVLDVVCKHSHISEILVVDDGSTDGTHKEVENYKERKIRLIRLKKNKGRKLLELT